MHAWETEKYKNEHHHCGAIRFAKCECVFCRCCTAKRHHLHRLWNRIPEFRVQHKPCRKSASLRCTARMHSCFARRYRRNTQHLSNRSEEWHTWMRVVEENRQNNCNYCFRADRIQCHSQIQNPPSMARTKEAGRKGVSDDTEVVEPNCQREQSKRTKRNMAK